jgi:long-chain acyl-CoA synthetase
MDSVSLSNQEKWLSSLIARPFSQDNGEMTPTMKVRRRVVQQHYKDIIDSMFRD